LLPLLALLLARVAPVAAQGQSLSDLIRSLTYHAKEGIEAAEGNKPELMRAEYEEIHAIWESFEGQVRAKDPAGYVELEAALDAIKRAAYAQPPDRAAVRLAYEQFEHTADEVADRVGGAAAPAQTTAATLPDALKSLDKAAAAIQRGDSAEA